MLGETGARPSEKDSETMLAAQRQGRILEEVQRRGAVRVAELSPLHGMNRDAGFTAPDLLEADPDGALVSAGRRLVVLADHTKWSTVGISTIAPLSQADVVVTDDGLGEDARTVLRQSVGDLLVTTTGGEREVLS